MIGVGWAVLDEKGDVLYGDLLYREAAVIVDDLESLRPGSMFYIVPTDEAMR